MVKAKFTLEQAMKTQKRSRGIALLFLLLWRQMEWVGNAMPRPFYSREKDLVTIMLDAGWDPRPVWYRCRKSHSHRDSNLGPSSPQPVATPTELFQPTSCAHYVFCSVLFPSHYLPSLQSVIRNCASLALSTTNSRC